MTKKSTFSNVQQYVVPDKIGPKYGLFPNGASFAENFVYQGCSLPIAVLPGKKASMLLA